MLEEMYYFPNLFTYLIYIRCHGLSVIGRHTCIVSVPVEFCRTRLLVLSI